MEDIVMQAQICSWGNGNAVRLNKAIMEALHMKTNDILDVTIENNAIVMRKSFVHKTLEQRVKESGIPLVSNQEYDFGEPLGGEYW